MSGKQAIIIFVVGMVVFIVFFLLAKRHEVSQSRKNHIIHQIEVVTQDCAKQLVRTRQYCKMVCDARIANYECPDAQPELDQCETARAEFWTWYNTCTQRLAECEARVDMTYYEEEVYP